MAFLGVLMLDTRFPRPLGDIGNQLEMDLRQAQQDVVDGALALTSAHPDVTTLVLECTNMPPYADAVVTATGKRVEHIVSLIEHQWRTLA